MSKYFIAVYTNEVKQYCDRKFFTALNNLSYMDKELHIVDNSSTTSYFEQLNKLLSEVYSSNQYTLEYLENPRDKKSKSVIFLENVGFSIQKLSNDFIKSDCDYMVIIESDVEVPSNTLVLFDEVLNDADIIGGIYYKGFHSDADVGFLGPGAN